MKDQEWTYVDRSKWEYKHGDWDNEPDKKQWTDKATGLPCLIVRGPSGALCGYVGVSKDHPYYEKDYDDVDVSVHWGLTFADHCHPDSKHPERGICHIVESGDDDNVWWLGFDCAHSGDVCPSYKSCLDYGDDSYKNMNYVHAEVTSLAQQLKGAG